MGLQTPTTAVAGGASLLNKPETCSFDPTAQYVTSITDSETASSSSSDGPNDAPPTRTQLRALLASSMSRMYRSEVPLYGDLISIITRVNSDFIRRHPTLLDDDEIARLNIERHGAIRVGTVSELTLLSRIFALFGMHPVGYYDLYKYAGLPIHATAFRPVAANELTANPFRIFCSLLRMDLISDPQTRSLAAQLLETRKIVSDRCIALLSKGERGEWGRTEALEFVEQVKSIFAWHNDTPVSLTQYTELAQVHPLVADIVSFRGPHINHLTPRTLDIDAVQQHMLHAGMDAKELIEGPPRRTCGIYLRQTSFHALSETVVFDSGKGGEGKHKARFGEIEARGQALTRRGARMYDVLMGEVARRKRAGRDESVLDEVFRSFPDTRDGILRRGLGYFTFSVKNESLAKSMWNDGLGCEMLADLVEAGALHAEPMTYEDFLPASAAGIFQSNLPSSASPTASAQQETTAVDEDQARSILETAVGGSILDYFELYSEQQRKSLLEVANVVHVDAKGMVDKVEQEQAK